MAFAPDGKIIISGGADKTIKLWDTVTWQLLRNLSGHQAAIISVAFAPDSKIIASGSEDKTIKVWNVVNEQLLWTLNGHQAGITSLAFDPDDQALVSGSKDKTVKLWDVAKGQLLWTFSGHEDLVTSVAFTKGRKNLTTGSVDNTIRSWDLINHQQRYITTISVDGGFLTFHPTSLRYRSSRRPGESEPASLRFNGLTNPVYPLHWYRDDLIISDKTQPFPEGFTSMSIVEPKWLRHAWVYWENREVWLIGTGLGYASLVTITILVLCRHDPKNIAKLYFKSSTTKELKLLASGVLGFSGDDSPDATLVYKYERLLAGQNPPDKTVILSKNKTYLIYTGISPTTDQLLAFREPDVQPLIPISAREMESALASQMATSEHLHRLEEPFIVRPDPYDESRAVEADVLFYGRQEALVSIPSALLQGQHVAIFGMRKVGKTSLLNRLRGALNVHPYVLIDCQAYAPVAIDLFNKILEKLRIELVRLLGKNLSSQTSITSANSFREQFLALCRIWGQYTTANRVILVFDELDKYFPERRDANKEPELFEFVMLFRLLRGLAQEERCLSVLAVAYRPDINRHNLLTETVGENPMHMSFQEFFLGFLSLDETITMIRELGRWRSIEWEDGAIVKVFELSGGHPQMARFIASDACEQGSQKIVTKECMNVLASELLNTLYKHRLGKYLEESIWKLLRPKEQEVLRMIVKNVSTGINEFQIGRDQEDALANLEHFGLLVNTSEGMRVRGSLLNHWVYKYEVTHGT